MRKWYALGNLKLFSIKQINNMTSSYFLINNLSSSVLNFTWFWWFFLILIIIEYNNHYNCNYKKIKKKIRVSQTLESQLLRVTHLSDNEYSQIQVQSIIYWILHFASNSIELHIEIQHNPNQWKVKSICSDQINGIKQKLQIKIINCTLKFWLLVIDTHTHTSTSSIFHDSCFFIII